MKWIKLFESVDRLWKPCDWSEESDQMIITDNKKYEAIIFTDKEIDSLKKFCRLYEVGLVGNKFINLDRALINNHDLSLVVAKNYDDYYYVTDEYEYCGYVCDTIEGLWQLLIYLFNRYNIEKHTEEKADLLENRKKLLKFINGCQDNDKIKQMLSIINETYQMKHIKLFESVDRLWRECDWTSTPTYSEIHITNKKVIYDSVPFTEKEIDSIRKFNRLYTVDTFKSFGDTVIDLSYHENINTFEVNILKNNDDYYYVYFESTVINGDNDYDTEGNKYVCDTIEGLWQLLEHLYQTYRIAKLTEDSASMHENKKKISHYLDNCVDNNKLKEILSLINK